MYWVLIGNDPNGTLKGPYLTKKQAKEIMKEYLTYNIRLLMDVPGKKDENGNWYLERSVDDELLNELEKMEKVIINAINVGIKNDVVKYFVPEALTTKLIMTVNLRELRHILALRTGYNVLAEFRWLCFELYKALPEDHKFLFSDIAKIFNSKDFGK